MRKLTDRQRKFVAAYVELGGHQTNSALAAGYSKRRAAVAGSTLVRNPRVLAAIREEAERHFGAGVALSTAVLIELARDKEVPPETRRKAANDILNRSGWILAERREVTINDNRTTEELLAEWRQLQAEMGGLLPPVIDVTPGSKPVAAISNRLETQANFDGNGLLDRAPVAESEEK